MAHKRFSDTIERARDQRKNPTPAERRLWSCLRAKKLNGQKFRRQHVIDGYIVDFFCRNQSLVVEVDGDHHSEADAMWHDERRTEHLESRGLRIIRFPNEQVMKNLTQVLESITAAMTR